MNLRRAARHIIICTWLTVIALFGATATYADDVLIVSPDGDLPTIQAALDVAETGDTIHVQGGTYSAPLIIDKSVTLIGVDYPVIDGEGNGSLVIIHAPDVRFEGFTVRNSGSSLTREDTGIVVQAPRVQVVNNSLEDVLYGIYFATANGSVAQGNTVRCHPLELSRRGDGLRVWYSSDIQLTGNNIFGCRDTLIWHTHNIIIERNNFYNNLYGLHFMYSEHAIIRENVFNGNSVAAYLMYSQHLTITDNYMIRNRGSGGYGIALKDVD